MANSESPRPPADAFYVLKQGGMHGPFTREELHARFTAGIFAMEDFVQAEGVPIWQPLARLLENEDVNPHGAIAPDWKSLLTWAWLRLRFDLDEQSVVAGWVCLAIGLLALLLSHWTFVFWLPWMMAALLAALALFQRRRMIVGGVMLAAAVGLPLAFFALEPKPKPAPPVIVGEKVEPPADRVEASPATPLPEIKLGAAASPPAALEPAPPVAVQEPVPVPAATPAPEPATTSEPPAPGMLASITKFFNGLRESASPASPTPIPSFTAAPPQVSAASVTPTPLRGAKSTPAVTPNTETKMPDALSVLKPEQATYLVKTDAAQGSAFLLQMQGKAYLVTNYHVLRGAKTVEFSNLSETIKMPSEMKVEVAINQDLVRIPVLIRAGLLLQPTPALDQRIDVYGNPGGQKVITRESGKILGLGPTDIEVSAQFIPGNSGGPIVDAEGRVVGVATYLLRHIEMEKWITSKTRFDTARRFGVRIQDSLKWSSTTWGNLSADTDMTTGIETFLNDAAELAYLLVNNPYQVRFVSQVHWPYPARRTKVLQVYQGLVDAYNNGCRERSITLDKQAAPEELRRINNRFESRIRGHVSNLGRCLQEGSTELNRLLYTFSTEHSRKEHDRLIEQINEFGAVLEKASKAVASSNMFKVTPSNTQQ